MGDWFSEMDDNNPGYYTAWQKAAEPMRGGGGVGYDFSRSARKARK